MSRETVVVPPEVEEAIRAFRGEGRDVDDECRFLTLSYADKVTLKVNATGPGGLAEAAAAVTPKEGNYLLLRLPFKVEISTTIKFAYVDYVPQGTSPMRRALLSTHKGQVEDLLKPFHTSIQASDESDLDEAEILQRLGAGAGTLSFVRGGGAAPPLGAQQSQQAQKGEQKPAPAAKKLVPESVKDERKVAVEGEDALRAAIADVRDDASETTWCLVSYATPTSLALAASGGGSVAALREAMSDADRYYYALFRVSYLVDESNVVRFGFVRVVSDKVSPMQRGRISTHIGYVKTVFGQYHHEFCFDSPAELTEDGVDHEMRTVMGLKSNVRDSAPAGAVSSTYTSASGTSKGGAAARAARPDRALATDSQVSFGDEAAFREAVAAVHSDADPATWAVARYSSKHTLTLVGRGDGDTAEMMAAVGEGFHIGIVRVTEQIDKSTTVKFALVKVMDPSVRPMVRGEINTVIGKLEALYQPYHVDLMASTPDEITHADVTDKVAKASMRR